MEEVQALQLTLNSYKCTVEELEEKLTDEDNDLVDIASALQDAQNKVTYFKDIIKRKRNALGVDG